ncbi:hypothetical protein EDD15DRAFT_2231673 [Pisolithus albus]|nr:hypothetical protein EDD15DRAFT_2231673 [Pisolithus albus]
MVVWLGGTPPVLEVGDKPCVRYRSLLKSRYEDIAAKCTVTSHVSLLDAFCNYRSCETEVACLPPLSPTAKLQANRILEPLMKKHGYDVRYSPPVNAYSECLRPWVAKLQCISDPSYQDGLPTAGLPNNIFDGVNDPWVVLGIIMTGTGTFRQVFAVPFNASTCLCSRAREMSTFIAVAGVRLCVWSSLIASPLLDARRQILAITTALWKAA